MDSKSVAAAVAALLLGGVVGVVVGRAGDDDGGAVVVSTEEECAEAQAVVDDANEELAAIGQTSAAQDRTYFSAVIVQLRTIEVAMQERPDCFTLAERAGAAGLVNGVELLGGGTPEASPGDAPTVVDPAIDPSGGGEEPVTTATTAPETTDP